MSTKALDWEAAWHFNVRLMGVVSRAAARLAGRAFGGDGNAGLPLYVGFYSLGKSIYIYIIYIYMYNIYIYIYVYYIYL